MWANRPETGWQPQKLIYLNNQLCSKSISVYRLCFSKSREFPENFENSHEQWKSKIIKSKNFHVFLYNFLFTNYFNSYHYVGGDYHTICVAEYENYQNKSD